MVKKLTAAQKMALIEKLSAKHASYVSFKNGYLSLKFDRRILRNKVKVKHDPGLGNWSRKHNIIYYDERLKAPDILPILVHEAVEKYAAQKYALRTQSEAHRVAMAIEKSFVAAVCCRQYKEKCTHSGRCWRMHQQRIQGAWLVENINIKRKKKIRIYARSRRKGN